MNQVILFYGDEAPLTKVAKKGSETDIRYYNAKIAGSEVSFLYPFKFPERIQTILSAASVANKAIVAISEIDKSLGEFILALDYYEIKHLGIIGNDSLVSLVKKITSGLGIEVRPMSRSFEDFEKFVSVEIENKRKDALIVIDQTFPVKGVGTVSLGFLLGGQVGRHQKMKSYPSGKEVDIKSIQVMDVDLETAFPFSRVGLAFRNVEVEDLPKGSILFSREGIQFVESLQLDVRTNPSVKVTPAVGEKVQINFLFNSHNAEISDISENRYLIDVDKRVPVIDEIFAISSLNSSPRILGAGKPGS